MTEPVHAKDFAPSSFERRMLCAGSAVLEANEPDSENEYSREGSIAHAVVEHCLINKVSAQTMMFIDYEGKTEIVPQDMRDHVQAFIDHLHERAKDAPIYSEQRYELEWLTGEKGAKGTCDASFPKGKVLETWDFKYGYKPVKAEGNPQIRIYSLCAARQFDMVYDFERVVNGIFQPRINNISFEELSIKELQDFGAKEVKDTIKRVEQAKKSNSLDGFLHPSEKACQWCKAAYKCPALASEVAKAASVDFEDETQTELITPVDLGTAMAKTELIETWLKNVRSKVEIELLAGRPVKGFKLVEGKKGNRDWVDEKETEVQLKKLKLPNDVIYDTSLRSVAQLEKKLKGKTDILDKLKKLYSQKTGKPSVAPVSDPRTTYDPKPAEDFDDLTE